jgi:hypothetical protein
MTDHAELIKRLCSDVMYDAFGDPIVPSLLDEAATALAAVVAENAGLREALSEMLELVREAKEFSDDWLACMVKARAALAQGGET